MATDEDVSAAISKAVAAMAPGYVRPKETTQDLIQAVFTALQSFPTQRLGQLIANVIPVGGNLFNLHDEELIACLNNYVEMFGKKD